MRRVAVIADNLIGANECGVQFRNFGLTTRVILNHTNLDTSCGDDEVIAVSTETRKSSSGEAYARVYKVATELQSLGFRLFYKKIDSTLRGQASEEIRAAMDALGYPLAIIVPAYPLARRIVKEGYLQIVQYPDEGSAFPVCYLPTVIRGRTSEVVGLLRESDVRAGARSLKRQIAGLCLDGIRLIVADAVTEEDLRTIATAIANIEIPCLAVGSAGLAAHLPIAWKLAEDRSTADRRILVLVGTSNRVSGEQVCEVARDESIALITLKSEEIYRGEWEAEMEKASAAAVAALSAGQVPVIAIDTLLNDWDCGLSLYERVKTHGPAIADLFAGITRKALAEGCVKTLVIVGGGTTTDVCQRVGATTIELDRELEFGVPIGTLAGGECSGLRIVTKGGGIGQIEILTKVLNQLRSS